MARLPRIVLPGQPQHIIQRGNNRQLIFTSTRDYEFYLEKLLYVANEYECQIHAYVLMTNHVHLLASPIKADSLSKMMQTLGRYYVQYFNLRYQRTGTLWDGRYKASLIHSEQYLFTCMRYIELNPVRAGIVRHPSEYMWSSYACNALGKDNPLIKPHFEYEHLDKVEEERRARYLALFDIPMTDEIIHNIRETTNKSWVLGDKHFKEDMALKLARRVEPTPRGGDRKSARYKVCETF